MYTVGLKHFFGMRQRYIDVYTADDSGPYRQLNPASKVKPHNRIDFLTHHGLIKKLSGPGLDPAFKRFAQIVPSAMMATLKIFMDPKLLSCVRSAVKDAANPTPELSFNIKLLEKQPLMLSAYAETFRLRVQVFVTGCSPHTVVHINSWLLPRNKISMVGSHPVHMCTRYSCSVLYIVELH